jgi:LysR family transcriptional regulator, hca operon transcriptional activator
LDLQTHALASNEVTLELRHLRYFLAVAKHLHFGRAADALHTAQPALSQQIRRLERELGGALFERTKRYVALTPLGSDLLDEAQTVVEAADRLAVRGRDASNEPRGHLQIGVVMPATIGIIPRAVPSYRSAFPAVELDIDTLPLYEHVPALIERRIDVAILREPIDDERIHVAPIATEYLCLVVPSGHPLAAQKAVDVSELNGLTLFELRPTEAGSFGEDIGALLRRHRVRLGARVQVSSVETNYALVSSGMGIAIGSTVLLSFNLEGVVKKSLLPQTKVQTMVVACRRDRRKVPTIASFIDHLASLTLTFPPPPDAH